MMEKEIVVSKPIALPQEDFTYGKAAKYFGNKAINANSEGDQPWIRGRR